MNHSQDDEISRKTFVHVPYDLVRKYLPFIREDRVNLEIYFGSVSFDSVTESDIMEIRRLLDFNPSFTMHAPFMDLSPGGVDPLVREVTRQRFNDVLDFAEILKPDVIVFHSGYDRRRFDDRMDIWLEGSIDTWTPVNKRAADMGVRIAIENIFEDEPGNLVELVKEINSDNFGICFDTGHFNMFSKLPLKEWLSLTRSFIKELHLHDNSRFRDEHRAIGDGDFEFDLMFRELAGIDCVYTIEAHNVEDVRKSMAWLRNYFSRNK